jgi:hypothetical protein
MYEEAVSHKWLCNWSFLNFLIYEENLIFFSVMLFFATGGACGKGGMGSDGGWGGVGGWVGMGGGGWVGVICILPTWHLLLPPALPNPCLQAAHDSHGRRNFKDTSPLVSSSLVILFGVVKQFCMFRIWSETECKIPTEYGPQYISTPPPPSHTLSVYIVHWEVGGGGRRSQRRYSRGATLNSTQV